MEEQDLEDVHHALVQQWGIGALEHERIAKDELIEALARRVRFLMSHDFERLLSGMYMIDVPEERFSEAVNLPEKDRPDHVIAQLIFERELQKMETRKRYAAANEDAPIPLEDEGTSS